jgi:hypothetical protein
MEMEIFQLLHTKMHFVKMYSPTVLKEVNLSLAHPILQGRQLNLEILFSHSKTAFVPLPLELEI